MATVGNKYGLAELGALGQPDHGDCTEVNRLALQLGHLFISLFGWETILMNLKSIISFDLNSIVQAITSNADIQLLFYGTNWGKRAAK